MVLLGTFAPRISTAQASPDSVHHRNDCRLAAQVVASGHPATKRQWAFGTIARCAGAGPVLAQAIRAHRASVNVVDLDSLTQPTFRLRDADVLRAAMEIAGDRGASSPARVFAIRTLIWSMYPAGGVTYEDLADVVTGRDRNCYGYGPSTHPLITQGTALPPDYITRAKELANTVLHDSTEARPVLRAAACLFLIRPWPGLTR
jgi:hypothetical protein